MRRYLAWAALGLGFLMCGCGVAPYNYVPVPAADIHSNIDVVGFEVTVPRDLNVSERHLYYPITDIVWRDGPPGRRHEQVDEVFTQAFARGLRAFDNGRPTRIDVEVRRFHTLTQKARWSVGGVHSMRFDLTVSDARTGEVLYGPEFVVADLRAHGGARALRAEAAGWDMRKRIDQHLAGVIQVELVKAGFGVRVGE